MRRFRAQPILDAQTLEVVALEVLAANHKELPYGDEAGMAAHDLEALEFAQLIHASTGLRTHCNLEWTTLWRAAKRLKSKAMPGIVVELVERYDALEHVDGGKAENALRVIAALRAKGAKIALDDVCDHQIGAALIEALRPDIVKVESRDALSWVRKRLNSSHVIAERIEQEEQAKIAIALGAKELQGYWCDEITRGLPAAVRDGKDAA